MGDGLNKQGEWYLRDDVLGYSLASAQVHNLLESWDYTFVIVLEVVLNRMNDSVQANGTKNQILGNGI